MSARVSILIIRHLRPDGDIDTYHLKSGRRYVVGRSSSAHIRVLDVKLSRAHAAIDHRDGVWGIDDAGSTNGLRVDAQQVTGWTPLKPGCRIRLGESTLICDHAVDPEQASSPTTVVLDD